jgi:hypothetical protein
MLRKHQGEADQITDRIIAGEPINTIYSHVTPGGGFRLELTPGGITPLSSAMTGKREMKFGIKELHNSDIPEKTPSEKEADLLGLIDDHIRTFSFQNRYNPKRINAEVFNHFEGKARRLMTIKELEFCLNYVRYAYPLSYVRGTGHLRVPTKAVRKG